MTVTLGVECFLDNPPAFLKELRLGLLCNQAATDRSFRHSRDLLVNRFGSRLRCLFSPQHGFFSEKQDNMIESADAVDRTTGLPVFSLYGEVRKPTLAMLEHIDVLVIDLVDVGTRVYTYIHTLAYCLQAAAETGKKVVVLDRPNPLGGNAIEGNLTTEGFFSFVGLYPIPMRHGLTIGEMALYLNQVFGINADLEVVAMKGWRRAMLFPETGLPWVFPSPNMPTFAAALVYPGQVLWEGTNISEGRGTALPFELCGAPFIEHGAVLEKLKAYDLPGVTLRPVAFEPTSNKWTGKACQGFQLHVIDFERYMPYRTSLALLQVFCQLWPQEFTYKKPPYEYDFTRLPLDLILGDGRVRQALETGGDLAALEQSWQPELHQYDRQRQDFFLYE